MKRYKQRAERRMVRQSKHLTKKLGWKEAVPILTCALTEAIWMEGGEHEDAVATAEIVYHAILRDLASWFQLENRTKPIKVVPFKRKASYLRERKAR